MTVEDTDLPDQTGPYQPKKFLQKKTSPGNADKRLNPNSHVETLRISNDIRKINPDSCKYWLEGKSVRGNSLKTSKKLPNVLCPRA